jgi:DNA-directed RNA polymerase subunit alpha
MSTLTCIETYIDKEQNHYGSFLIEPLETGQGITLGNAIRRTLLSDLIGFAITGVRINDLKHEFAVIDGLREDPLEVLLNLKEIIFKNSSFLSPTKIEKNSFQYSKYKGFLHVKGPLIVTAGMFQLPKNVLKIINPNQYICTIITNSELFLEIDIENGKGYQLTDETRKKNLLQKLSKSKASTLLVDALFMPIKKVNYKIKLIHDSEGNIKESLNLEILTNGSITPKRSLHESIKILMNLFYSLFLDFKYFSNINHFLIKKKKIKYFKKNQTIEN